MPVLRPPSSVTAPSSVAAGLTHDPSFSVVLSYSWPHPPHSVLFGSRGLTRLALSSVVDIVLELSAMQMNPAGRACSAVPC